MYLLFYTDKRRNENDYEWYQDLESARFGEAELRKQGVILGPAYILERVEVIYE